MDTVAKKCFIITPIGDEKDPIRRHIDGIIEAAISPALGHKYEIKVAHKISEPGSITKQIISEIYNADLVVANITNRNPNVMYELALRHAMGRPVITIAEKDTPLPADIISQRTIFYYNDAKGVLELREELIKAEENIDFDKKCGPIVDVINDIQFEAHVVQQAKLRSENDAQPFEYIIEKLNHLESDISSLKSEYRYSEAVKTIFDYYNNRRVERPNSSFQNLLSYGNSYEEVLSRIYRDKKKKTEDKGSSETTD